MEFRLSRHARRRMGEREVSESDLRLVVDDPSDIRPGRTGTLAYHRVVNGVPLIAILTANTDVPIVVTVMLDES